MNAVGKVTNGKFEEFANTGKGGGQNLGALTERVATAEREITEIKDTAQNQGKELAGKVDSDGGDVSDTVITFQQATELANVNSGDSMSVALAKLAKLYEELDGKAGYYSVSNNVDIFEDNVLMDGKILSRELKNKAESFLSSISTSGWLRIASYPTTTTNVELFGGNGESGIIFLSKDYQYSRDESYIISFCGSYGQESKWNCLNSNVHNQEIQKIRFSLSPGKSINLEIYYSSNALNRLQTKIIGNFSEHFIDEGTSLVMDNPEVISEYSLPMASDISNLEKTLNPSWPWFFKNHYIDDRNYSSHIDVLKAHWNTDLYNGEYNWGFRFVTTYYGVARQAWICWAYGDNGNYGWAINAGYDTFLNVYYVNNGSWSEKRTFAYS